ncbi:MAG: hypothetical protein ACHQDD_06800 [Steroidobacterales bacterium]
MAATLAACGQAADKTGAAGQSRQPGPEKHKAGDLLDPDMVAAVSSAHSSTPIAMKFRLSARPVIGVPLQVVVALIPAADVTINRIHASFQPGDGLQLQTERSLDINDPSAGGMIEQELSVVPQQPGVLSLNATVVVDMDGGSLSRSYAIPLIASDKPAAARSP